MDINRTIIIKQRMTLRKIKDFKFTHGDYEFRLNYRGGLGEYIAIDYRAIGKRNFKYFGGVGAHDCLSQIDAIQKCCDFIDKKLFNKNLLTG